MNQTPFKNNLILQEGEQDYTGCLTGGTGWTTLIKLLPVTNSIFGFRAAITEKYKNPTEPQCSCRDQQA